MEGIHAGLLIKRYSMKSLQLITARYSRLETQTMIDSDRVGVLMDRRKTIKAWIYDWCNHNIPECHDLMCQL